jgi:hypothetical protein
MKGGIKNAETAAMKKMVSAALKNPKREYIGGGKTYVFVKTYSDGPAPAWSAQQAEYVAKVAGYDAIVHQGEHMFEWELWVAKKRK